MSTLLPELPEPKAYATSITEGRVIYLPRGSLNTDGWAGIYSADQVRAIQLEAWKAGVEHAAKVCDEAHPHDWTFLAAAIRSLPSPE